MWTERQHRGLRTASRRVPSESCSGRCWWKPGIHRASRWVQNPGTSSPSRSGMNESSGVLPIHTPPWPTAMPVRYRPLSQKTLLLVEPPVVIRVFEDQDSIGHSVFLPDRVRIVLDDPDSTTIVKVERDRAPQIRFAGEQRHMKPVGHGDASQRLLRRQGNILRVLSFTTFGGKSSACAANHTATRAKTSLQTASVVPPLNGSSFTLKNRNRIVDAESCLAGSVCGCLKTMRPWCIVQKPSRQIIEDRCDPRGAAHDQRHRPH
ncbi:MAG: hypothetical protein CM1200mP2_54080 [Planctomycetaceae bacterium]|nr:MAG: hypothetical protein CM1200mP2_54080 [Planctomycetaceae bacterium]